MQKPDQSLFNNWDIALAIIAVIATIVAIHRFITYIL